jgi:hypothetical protein
MSIQLYNRSKISYNKSLIFFKILFYKKSERLKMKKKFHTTYKLIDYLIHIYYTNDTKCSKDKGI